jgi:hypothetical protein
MSRKKQWSRDLAEARHELEISDPDVSLSSSRLLIVATEFLPGTVLDL